MSIPRVYDFSILIASPGSEGVDLMDAVAQSLTPPTTKELLNASLNENYKNGRFGYDPLTEPNNYGIRKGYAYAFGIIDVHIPSGEIQIQLIEDGGWINQKFSVAPYKIYKAFSKNVRIKNGSNVSVTGRLYITAVD